MPFSLITKLRTNLPAVIDAAIPLGEGDQRSVEDGIVRRLMARLERSPRFERDHGLRARRRPQRRHEGACIAGVFDVEQDAIGGAIEYQKIQ